MCLFSVFNFNFRHLVVIIMGTFWKKKKILINVSSKRALIVFFQMGHIVKDRDSN
jgi:hypothetical protein